MNVLSLFDGMSGAQLALQKAGIPVNKYFASEVDKYAMQVTQDKFPNTIQLGSVEFITRETFGSHRIDLLVGGSPCFKADTPIITEQGIKPILDVSIGDLVLTHDGTWRKVLATGGKVSETYKLLSQSSTGTITTEEHPYYVMKRNLKWENSIRNYKWDYSEPTWTEVKNITNGDFVATPILKSSENQLNITPDEAFLIGLYIGDGHTRKDHKKTGARHWQLIISVGEHEEQMFKQEVNLKHSFYSHSTSTYRAVFSNKRMVEYVEKNCGSGAENKFLSKEILDLPVELLKRVIDGYLFADGSFRNKTFRATTVSRKLVETLSLAVAKAYNTTTSIEFTKRPSKTIIEGRTVNQRDTWTISFRKEHPKGSKAFVTDDFIWNPVKSIEKTGAYENVYNLEVEISNSYIANNHVVHNCQGFSFAGKQLNFQDPRSALFFEYVRLLRELRPKYFLLENVKMKKEYQEVITGLLGVEPIEINSSLVSAQTRKRLYWTNIPGVDQPEDKGIVLRDIIDYSVSTELSEKEMAYMERGNDKWKGAEGSRLKHYGKTEEEQAGCLTANMHKGVPYGVIGLTQYEDKLRHPEATKKGYAEAGDGEGLDLTFPNSKTRRGRSMPTKANCLTAAGHDMGVVFSLTEVRSEEAKRIRKEVREKTGKDFNPFRSKDIKAREDGKVGCIQTSLTNEQKVMEVCGIDKDGNECYVDREKSHAIIASIGRTTEREYFKKNQGQMVLQSNGVKLKWRKLTPLECERLQTCPDGHTLVLDPVTGKQLVSNSQRYKMLGNGFTVDVIAHILKGICTSK